jgi:hypothetical protein
MVLSELTKLNKAQVLSTGRLRGFNNLASSLTLETKTPVLEFNLQQNANSEWCLTPGLLTNRTQIKNLKINITPSVNADNTVTCQLQTQFDSHHVTNLILAGGKNAEPAAKEPAENKGASTAGLPAQSHQAMNTVFNVQDAQSIVVGGLAAWNSDQDIRIGDGTAVAKTPTRTNLLLVTTRVVKDATASVTDQTSTTKP